MARYTFKMPDIGEGIVEAEIVKWHVAVGDAVREEQPLVDVMTDKATVEIAAPVAGKLLARAGVEGSKVAVGAELVAFETAAGPEAATAALPTVQAPPATKRQGTDSGPSVPAASQNGGWEKAVGRALAAPAVRARAKSLGVELSLITGGGPDGQVIHADLDRALLSRPVSGAAKRAAAIPPGRYTEAKMLGLRRIIAERMADANRRIPHFTYVEEVDVTALEDLRETLNAGQPNRHLTVLSFIARAVLDALGTHKHLNSLFDDGEGLVRTYEPVHLGIATQTSRGLLVPVIRNARALTLNELAAAIAGSSETARQGASRREDLMGSTITITSLGALGGIMATPIINPPEVAIVGVNRIVARPVVRDGMVAVRKMMNLSSSFDHRVIDGHAAAAFIRTVRERLEAPEQLLASR